MKISPNIGSIHKAETLAPLKAPSTLDVQPPAISLPSESYVPQQAPAAPPIPGPAASQPEAPAKELKAEASPPPPPAAPKPPETQNWMDTDWNLAPSAPGLSASKDDFWKYPSQKSSDLHHKSMIIEDEATYFVSGSGASAAGMLGLNGPGSLSDGLVGLSGKTYGPSDHLPASMAITNFNQMAMDQQMKFNDEMQAKQSAYYAQTPEQNKTALPYGGTPEPGPSLGITNFAQQAAEHQAKLMDQLKAQNPYFDQAAFDTGLNQVSSTTATSAVAATEKVAAKPTVPTVGGMTRDQIIQGVNAELKALGAPTNTYYAVDEKLFPSLDKVKLNPVEFFTARACWQGVNTKRRAQLEAVLDQFPKLPKDQKNWQSAVKAAKAGGSYITKTDEVFIKYFIENRKEMKQLFRATLTSGFQGNSALCYRGQSSSSEFGPHSTKPLGCYSIDPGVSEAWSAGNLKQFKVKLNDIWSTYTVTQNNNRCERELTVYSRGGIRKGEKVKDVTAAKLEFNGRYASDELASALEVPQYNYG